VNGLNILVTQGDMKHTLGIVRSLGTRGANVHVLAESKRAAAAISRFCKQAHIMASSTEKEYVRQLLDILKSQDFDVLIPVGYPVTEYTARAFSDISAVVNIVLAPIESIEFASNKPEITRFADSVGVPTPRTTVVASLAEVQQAGDEMGYPLIIKGRRETGSGIVSIVQRSEDLYEAYKDLVDRHGLEASVDFPIIQEFIPGWGCGFFAIYDNGKAKRVFMHRRVREYPISGGSSSCAESFYDESLKEHGIKLLDSLKWHGVAMVEFRYDTSRHDYRLIEINPKFWGSLDLALKAGADFPGDMVKIAMGNEISYTETYKSVRFQWPFYGDFLHVFDTPSLSPRILGDFLNPRVSKNFRLDDPLPDMVSAAAFAKALMGKAVRRIRGSRI